MYKYQDMIDQMPDCPPNTCTPASGEAFRFVFDNMQGNSFIPVRLQQPSRIYKNDAQGCSATALSMYESEQQARSAVRAMQLRFKNITQTLGSYLAKGNLSSDLGNRTQSDQHGHFDLHEFKDTQLPAHFEIVGELS